MEETKTCPYCGEEILAVAKKCKHCGEWLPIEKTKIPCPVCGEEIDEDTVVCPHCNEKVKEEAPTPTTPVNNPTPKPDGEKKNWKMIGIAGCAILAIVAIVWAMSSGSGESGNSNLATTENEDSATAVEVAYADEPPATDDIDDYEVGDYEAMKNNYKPQWKVRYAKDAFGDEDRSRPSYTLELDGTTDLVQKGEPCILCIIVQKPEEASVPMTKVFLMRNGDNQRFYKDTQLYFKMNSGEKFSISCDVDDNGSLWLGNSIEELQMVMDIFEEGYFTIAIRSANSFGDKMNCVFESGLKTIGIKQYFR